MWYNERKYWKRNKSCYKRLKNSRDTIKNVAKVDDALVTFFCNTNVIFNKEKCIEKKYKYAIINKNTKKGEI